MMVAHRLVQVTAMAACAAAISACSRPSADLLLVNGRVYTMAWGDPGPNGEPAADAPPGGDGWRPDATAIAIRGGTIEWLGSDEDAHARRGERTVVRDLQGATVLPGLIDSHVHLAELGASLERVNLVGVATEAEVIDRVAARAAQTPAGEWIVGWGWDEGAWANRYPDLRRLSERVPNHPVVLRGLHSFAMWGNRLALERAGITAATAAPAGGEIRKDAAGHPTGLLTNQAGDLLMRAVPAPTPAQLDARVTQALETLARAGYVGVHEAGADTALLDSLTRLDAAGRLPVRVIVYLAGRDTALIDAWRPKGPWTSPSGALAVRGVKAFYDGAMGSRGAYFFEDYSDRSGHRGRGGADYGFDAERMSAMMRAGFQLMIHAIGDRANREALDRDRACGRRGRGTARDAAAHRARAGGLARRSAAIRIPGRDRLHAAVARRGRHGVGRGAHRPAADGRRLCVAIDSPGRRPAGPELGPARHRLRLLLRAALGRHAPGPAARPGRRVACAGKADD